MPAATPRSYLVSTPTGSVRQHLTVAPESHGDPDSTNVPEQIW